MHTINIEVNDRLVGMNSKQQNSKQMDNVGIVVKSLDEVVSLFSKFGLQLEGRAIVEGEWAGRLTCLARTRIDCAVSAVLNKFSLN